MNMRLLIVTGVTLLLAGPALSAPFCTDDRGGVSIQFGHGKGLGLSESDLNDADLTELQQRGVNASSVERWNGCIRAFVRQPGGGETMEFYDPNTMQRVY
ncbi:MAG TPA: hypothetical protein VL133_13390 [Devosia sp.]|nr:hypothetical protein [Devosia sp.]